MHDLGMAGADVKAPLAQVMDEHDHNVNMAFMVH